MDMNLFLLIPGTLSKSVCSAGSSECTGNEMKMCDKSGQWITMPCPAGTMCEFIGGKVSCGQSDDDSISESMSLEDDLALLEDNWKNNKNISNLDDFTSKNQHKKSKKKSPKKSKNKSAKKPPRKKQEESDTKSPKKSAQKPKKSKKPKESKKTKTVTVYRTDSLQNKQQNGRNSTKSQMEPSKTIGDTDKLISTLSDLINKARAVTMTKTVTEKVGPKELKLEYTGPGQAPQTASPEKPNTKGAASSSPGAPGASSSPSSPSGASSGSGSPGSSPSSSGSSPSPSPSASPSPSPSASPSPSPSPSPSSSPSPQPTSAGNAPSSPQQSSSAGGAKPSSSPSSQPASSSPSNQPKQPDDKKSDDKKGSSGGSIIDKETLSGAMKESGFQPKDEYLDAMVDGVNKGFQDKAMACQFIAQCAHESGGFQFVEEIDCAGDKCAGKYGSDQGAPGKQYYGRGFIQLSWPDNYKAASQKLYQNTSLFDDPDQVAKVTEKAYGVSEWFWKTNVEGKEGVGPDHFGYSTKAINGELECKNNNNIDKSKKRYEIYQKLAKAMKLEKVADEKGCYTA